MAWVGRRGRQFLIKFHHGQTSDLMALGTTDEVEAEQDLSRCRENLRLLERGRLTVPEGAELGRFLRSDGRLKNQPAFVAAVFARLRIGLHRGGERGEDARGQAVSHARGGYCFTTRAMRAKWPTG
ncbi:hypothetical protein V5E97_26550 [Singulisphaera sp. Ch08]|uniref:Uncharacterized protein n=1 Tax=Singulisphaera sp. Ch08 TaxID=3120278 RepID=A0AAU7C913_9BACT